MTGILIGELILWLIVAIVAIVIGVYIVNWLYHRSSKEVSFVRTGFLGERVVINGGAFVLPFIHDYTPVNMNVLPMGIVRAMHDAVITRDLSALDPLHTVQTYVARGIGMVAQQDTAVTSTSLGLRRVRRG